MIQINRVWNRCTYFAPMVENWVALVTGSKASSAGDCAHECAVADGCSPAWEAPCLHVALGYAEKMSLCDQLEAIADSLPHRVNRLECLRVGSRLAPLMRDSHRYEEEVLFPMFEQMAAARRTSTQTILRLKSEHIYDEGAAEEITEQLMWIGRGGDIANAETLGFMLRAFFDTVRRHIAFEREHIFPAVRQPKPGSIASETG